MGFQQHITTLIFINTILHFKQHSISHFEQHEITLIHTQRIHTHSRVSAPKCHMDFHQDISQWILTL